MTYDEAISYIRSHPAQFAGASEDMVMSQIQSSNDANYYDPTLYEPSQKATVAKPNTAARGATVTPAAAPRPAATASKTSAPVTSAASLKNALIAPSSFKLPKITTPVALGIGLLVLGAGFGVYRAQR